MALIYKIMTRDEWEKAHISGVFTGSPVDIRDGFIHLSAPAQLRETAARHFAGQTGLMLVAVEDKRLGDRLKWEASRGGALFPHLYGPLAIEHIADVTELRCMDGAHLFPESIPQ